MNKQVLGGPDGDYTWSFGLISTLLTNNNSLNELGLKQGLSRPYSTQLTD